MHRQPQRCVNHARVYTLHKHKLRYLLYAQEVDLCILIDITGTMENALTNVKTQIKQLLEDLEAEFPSLNLRVAISAYRDHGDPDGERKLPNYETIDFESDITKVETFLDGLEAKGE